MARINHQGATVEKACVAIREMVIPPPRVKMMSGLRGIMRETAACIWPGPRGGLFLVRHAASLDSASRITAQPASHSRRASNGMRAPTLPRAPRPRCSKLLTASAGCFSTGFGGPAGSRRPPHIHSGPLAMPVEVRVVARSSDHRFEGR
jgi:hypothetical protein